MRSSEASLSATVSGLVFVDPEVNFKGVVDRGLHQLKCHKERSSSVFVCATV